MTIPLELTAEQSEHLQQEATKRGLSAAEYAQRLIESSLPLRPPASHSLWYTLTPEEWVQQTREWTDSNHDLPILSDEAISREGICEGRP